MLFQGHRATGILEPVQSLCCKDPWSNWDVCDGRLCKSDDCEKFMQVRWTRIILSFALLVMIFTLNNILCSHSSKLICVNISIQSTTKLYSLIPVWMKGMCTQGHRATGNLELVQSLRFKVTLRKSKCSWRLITSRKSGDMDHLNIALLDFLFLYES